MMPCARYILLNLYHILVDGLFDTVPFVLSFMALAYGSGETDVGLVVSLLGTALSTVAGWALAGYRVGLVFPALWPCSPVLPGWGLRVRRCQRHTRQRWHGPQVSGGKTLRASQHKQNAAQQAQPPPVGQPILAGWSDAAKIKGCNHAAAVIPPASHRALSAGLFSMRMVWAADAPPNWQGVLPCCWRCYGINPSASVVVTSIRSACSRGLRLGGQGRSGQHKTARALGWHIACYIKIYTTGQSKRERN